MGVAAGVEGVVDGGDGPADGDLFAGVQVAVFVAVLPEGQGGAFGKAQFAIAVRVQGLEAGFANRGVASIQQHAGVLGDAGGLVELGALAIVEGAYGLEEVQEAGVADGIQAGLGSAAQAVVKGVVLESLQLFGGDPAGVELAQHAFFGVEQVAQVVEGGVGGVDGEGAVAGDIKDTIVVPPIENRVMDA